jgi:hypothetical protein
MSVELEELLENKKEELFKTEESINDIKQFHFNNQKPNIIDFDDKTKILRKNVGDSIRILEIEADKIIEYYLKNKNFPSYNNTIIREINSDNIKDVCSYLSPKNDWICLWVHWQPSMLPVREFDRLYMFIFVPGSSIVPGDKISDKFGILFGTDTREGIHLDEKYTPDNCFVNLFESNGYVWKFNIS